MILCNLKRRMLLLFALLVGRHVWVPLRVQIVEQRRCYITDHPFFRGSGKDWLLYAFLLEPKISCRAIIGGWNGPPAQAGTQRKQYARFVPQVAKLVEDAEEETPRTLVKGICENENPLDYAVKSARCNSTSVAEAAAAAAAAAAASSAAAAVAESAKAVGDRAEGGGADDDSVARPNPTVSLFQSFCSCARRVCVS